METRTVVGREHEIDALDDVLDHVTDGPCGLVLEGEAGIGKTTLWREAVAGAVRRGHRVLACRPVESEAQLGFAALEELLATTPEAAFAELPGPQRRALEVALLRRDAGAEAAPHPRAVALGALGVLRTLATATPVIIAVDDAQWLDRPSAGVLEFIARRLEREPVGFVLAQRSAQPGGPTLDAERALGDRARRVAVGPIDVAAMTRLLGARLDRRLPAPVVAAVHATAATDTARWSGGQPPGSALSNAISRARRCGSARPDRTSGPISAKRSPSAANESLASACTGRQDNTR